MIPFSYWIGKVCKELCPSVLCTAIYELEEANREKDWVALTDSEIYRRTFLSKKELEAAIIRLTELNLIVVRHCNDGIQRLFKINEASLEKELLNAGARLRVVEVAPDLTYGKEWKGIRRKIINRDGCCQDCQTVEDLAVHHIIPFKEFAVPHEAHTEENLVTLCRSCHASRHARKELGTPSKISKPPAQNVKAKKPKADLDSPLSQEEFVKECDASPQKHVKLIGFWASSYPPDCHTRGQWGAFLKRCLRAAVDASRFSPDQINAAVVKLFDESKRLNYVPTLDSLVKKLIS